MKKNTSSKMSVFSCVTMTMGAIIGSGVFVFLPMAIGAVGDQIVLACIFTAIYVCMKQLPMTYMQSSLPVTASSYVYLAKFIHPTVAFIQSANGIIGMLNVAVMSNTFATYAATLFGFSESAGAVMAVSATACVALAVIGYFGARISGQLQNVIVGVLIVALGVYVIGGLGFEGTNEITFADMLIPTFDFAVMWTAIGYINYALAGGAIIASFAEEVDNPGFTIPFSFFMGTAIVTVIYILIAVVTYKAGPITDDPTSYYSWVLSSQASRFLSPTLTAFFLAGGGMFATITTLNGSYMIYSRMMFAAARDGIWPKAFAKTNKYGVPFIPVIIVCCVSLFFILSGIPTTEIMTVTSIPALLLGFIFYIPIVIFPFKYPNCAKNAWFRLPAWLNYILIAFAVSISLSSGIAMFKTLQLSSMISMGIFYAIAFTYYFIRLTYLKKNGRDLIAEGKAPIASWDEREAAYAAEAAKATEAE